MKLVDRQVTRELVGPFVFGVTAFTSVFFAGTYMTKLTEWLTNGMSIITAAEIVLLVLPWIVVYTLSMATLLSVLLGIGRLSGDSEIVALFAGGISLYRVAVPVLCMGFLVSASSFVLSEWISPRAYSRYQSIISEVLKQERPSDQPFTVRDGETNSQIMVNGGMDTDTGVLRDVTVMQFLNNRPAMVLYASRATWAGMNDEKNKYKWQLHDGWSQQMGTDSPVMAAFSEWRINEVEIQKTPSQFSLYQKSLQRYTDQLSFAELTQIIKYVKQHPDRPVDKIRELEVNRWNKISLPLSSMVFALLAAPLGIRPYRSSSSVGFGLSILIAFLYWMVWHYTSQMAIQGVMAPAVGAFMADVLGIVGAVLLLRRAAK